MNTIDFSDRVAVITGAGAGLGRDYAIELARRGAKVVVNDLGSAPDGSGNGSGAAADQVVSEIKASGGKAVPNYDNVATEEGGENIIRTAIDTYGKVDILINNAGILRDKTFGKMLPENWDAVINVHLRGTYCVTRPAFANMKQNGYGRIIMTASASGVLGNFGQANYAAAKMGIVGLANVLKLEGVKYNIGVNVLLPSAGTRLTEDVFTEDMFARFKVEWITPAVLYLCAEECQDTGMYINTFAGHFSRSAILTNPGLDFDELPTPEQIMEKWDKITDLKEARLYHDVNAMIEDASNLKLVKP
jgi:NAD(P)-dependent dehydrogenase (short-subunit alcohol dehydrogenase family)